MGQEYHHLTQRAGFLELNILNRLGLGSLQFYFFNRKALTDVECLRFDQTFEVNDKTGVRWRNRNKTMCF